MNIAFNAANTIKIFILNKLHFFRCYGIIKFGDIIKTVGGSICALQRKTLPSKGGIVMDEYLYILLILIVLYKILNDNNSNKKR